ncbi:MAG: hypothetical protein ACLFUZ_05350 [Candidatus Micrarchaeia archaeon]
MSKSKFFLNNMLKALPPVFTIKNLSVLGGPRTAYRLLSELQENKMVCKAGKGLYGKVAEDPYLVAYLSHGGYIGFSSALYIQGLKTETERRIYVCSFRSGKVPFWANEFVLVNMRGFLFGTRKVVRNGQEMLASTPAKTLFDMCHRPKYSDFYCMYRALNWKPFSSSDWKELLRYCAMAPLSTVRRVGYIVEGKAPKSILRKLESLASDKGVSFLFKPGGEYSPKWRLYDSEYVRRWIDEA